MADGIRWVGLDVHARQSTVAVFDQANGEVLTRMSPFPGKKKSELSGAKPAKRASAGAVARSTAARGTCRSKSAADPFCVQASTRGALSGSGCFPLRW
jgi:hypothetical protein